MRYIAIFLLLANIAYFGWNRFGQPPLEVPAMPESRPLLNNGLMLVSEFRAQAAEQDIINREASRKCSVVTGFSTSDDANSFIAVSRDQGLEARLNLTGEPLDSQFRVYLPPASSRQIATIILDNLSERAREAELLLESYLITRGLLENGIALGVYGDSISAQTVQEQVAGLGYSAEIEEIQQSDGEIQVWLGSRNSLQLEEAQWLDLSADRPSLTRTENLCETIAQGTQFP